MKHIIHRTFAMKWGEWSWFSCWAAVYNYVCRKLKKLREITVFVLSWHQCTLCWVYGYWNTEHHMLCNHLFIWVITPHPTTKWHSLIQTLIFPSTCYPSVILSADMLLTSIAMHDITQSYISTYRHIWNYKMGLLFLLLKTDKTEMLIADISNFEDTTQLLITINYCSILL